jgi:hypothetical protein
VEKLSLADRVIKQLLSDNEGLLTALTILQVNPELTLGQPGLTQYFLSTVQYLTYASERDIPMNVVGKGHGTLF